MSRTADIRPFQEAAVRVRNRIGLVSFARWLRRSHWIAGVFGLILVLVLRQILDWRSGEFRLIAFLLAGWILAGLILSFARRPGLLRALTIFDEKGGWNDCFSSAYFFLRGRSGSESLSRGERLHVDRAGDRLPEALSRLPGNLPLPRLSFTWILPLLALVFAASPLVRKELSPGDALLTEEMLESAQAEADRIRKAARDLAGLQALDEEEKKELARLEAAVDVAAEEITSPEGQTARDVLSTLESRARAAERLAEKLGVHSGEWASEEFIRELSQHADTADLAIGIRDKNPDLVAGESESIGEILGRDDLKPETGDRFTIALERSVAKATGEDAERPVGQRIGNASRQLMARQPKAAAGEFDELAKHFRRAQQRDEARQKLEKLASQLRMSGSQISGSKLESLKSIGDPAKKPLPEGLTPVQTMPLNEQLQDLMAPQIPQPGQMGTPMPIPGSLGEAPGGNQPGSGPQSGQKGALSPVPGQSPTGEDGQGLAMNGGPPGAGEGENGGFLSAPIPGAGGSNAPGSMLGGGAGGGQSAAGSGGNEAGSGTMEMFEQKGRITAAEKESRIAAQISGEGDSEFRAVDSSSVRQEEAKLSRKEIVKSFIDVEEEALDEQTLPLTRRRQVLRYFSEIRQQLEREE